MSPGPIPGTEDGTPGVIYLMDFCGACRNCAWGFTNQCSDKRGDVGFNKDGGYGTHVCVNESIFFPVDDDIPLTEATLLLDVMGTTGHAIRRGGSVRGDIRSVGIAGAGPVGLGVLAMSRILLGPEVPVLVSDLVPYRLGLAAKLGGLVVDLNERTVTEGVEDHGLEALDLAIDTSGKGAARRAYLDALDRRGVLVCAGHGEGLHLEVSRDLIAPERAVLGSEYFGYGELASNLELFREHLPLPAKDHHPQVPGKRRPIRLRTVLRRRDRQGRRGAMNGKGRLKVAGRRRWKLGPAARPRLRRPS